MQGEDGKWSNVDSRVAMKFHTVINAEGDLAARTDPTWIAALARYGFTLDAEGEIAELAHAVRPLSRRSNQIERNRAVLLARWRHDHTGSGSVTRGAAADRSPRMGDRPPEQAGRPRRGRLGASRPRRTAADRRAALRETARGPAAIDAVELPVELSLLAARAVVEADARSAPYGGRFSQLDIRAGATRALAASGIVGERRELQAALDEIIAQALTHTIDLIPEDPDRPDHIKGLMASSTAALKLEIADRFDALTRAGVTVDPETIAEIAADVLPAGVCLDERQIAAASAIAGTDRLVSITGPAGAGKTTMLRVAHSALARRGHRMFVVAPTKKAASVAGREIGTSRSQPARTTRRPRLPMGPRCGWRRSLETTAAGRR